MTEIGPARVSEAPAIAEMSREYVERGLSWRWRAGAIARLIRSTDVEVAVARDGQRLLGFGIMELGEERAHLILLAVAPEARRTGLGARLVGFLEEMARTAGVFKLQLEVRLQNGGARTFYQQLGFREVQLLPRYYDGRESAVRMEHDLERA